MKFPGGREARGTSCKIHVSLFQSPLRRREGLRYVWVGIPTKIQRKPKKVVTKKTYVESIVIDSKSRFVKEGCMIYKLLFRLVVNCRGAGRTEKQRGKNLKKGT
jgi:hypothetical protein